MLLKKLATINPENTFNVPIASVYSAPYEFQFKIAEDGENMGLESYPWREIKAQRGNYAQQIECTNNTGAQNILLNVNGQEQIILTERSEKLGSLTYNLDVRPLIIIKNCLPETLHYTVCTSEEMVTGNGFNEQ